MGHLEPLEPLMHLGHPSPRLDPIGPGRPWAPQGPEPLGREEHASIRDPIPRPRRERNGYAERHMSGMCVLQKKSLGNGLASVWQRIIMWQMLDIGLAAKKNARALAPRLARAAACITLERGAVGAANKQYEAVYCPRRSWDHI